MQSKDKMEKDKVVTKETIDSKIINLFKDERTKIEAFNTLVDEYQEMTYLFIRRMVLIHEDTNDILQNTFIKIWKGLEKFRGESKISTWIYRIATNESITFLNKKNKMKSISLDNQESNTIQLLSSDSYYTGDEIQMKLQAALSTLPEKQKAVFILKYYDAKSYVEISEITGTSVGALKASYHHAVKKIENSLRED